MFFPYLRGRQVELLALRDLVPKLAIKKKVCPIVEPVMANTRDLSAFLNAAKGSFHHVVLINPAVGDLVGKMAQIEAIIAPFLTATGNTLTPGFHVGPGTTLAQIQTFLTKYGMRQTLLLFDRPNPALLGMASRLPRTPIQPIVAFIDGKVSPSFIGSFATLNRVLVRNGFIAQVKNANYPPLDFFTDLNKTYQAMGYFGFGDFTVVDDVYAPGGGPAHAVAIHLTEQNSQLEIDCRHFVSNRIVGPVDPAGKFLEALDKLVAHVRANPTAFSYSAACQEFQGLHTSQHFPGLPMVKRLSIRHHIELMDHIV